MTGYQRDSYGDYSWATPTTLGGYSDGMVYIEGNSFVWDPALRNSGEHHDSCIDNNTGARWVFRHNSAFDMAIMTHGVNGGGRLRGLRQFELYENNFTSIQESNRNGCIYGILIRGGTGVAFNNQLLGPVWQRFAKLNLDMEFKPEDYPNAIAAWGENLCTGANPYDPVAGYPCIDQPGAGQDTGIWSGNPALPAKPNGQQIEPIYFWSNTFETGSAHESTSTKIQSGRDYFWDTVNTDYVPYPFPHPLSLIEVGS
jgi:hypothetical protein